MTSTATPSARGTVLAAFGVASVLVAIGVVVGVAPASLLGPIAELNATEATGVLGILLVGYALHRRRRNAQAGMTRLRAANETDEPADLGQTVDAALRDVATTHAFGTREQRQQVRTQVRRTAVRAYQQRHGVPRNAAVEAVATGVWTDDVVAAAFIGDERAPRFPVRERLRGWLHSDRAYRRRTERAAAAVHDFATEATR